MQNMHTHFKSNRNEVTTIMHTSRVDFIREHALILLAQELSDDVPTPVLPVRASREAISLRDRPPVQQETPWRDHVLTFAAFLAISFALFAVVSQ
jgi:hypothetical protein